MVFEIEKYIPYIMSSRLQKLKHIKGMRGRRVNSHPPVSPPFDKVKRVWKPRERTLSNGPLAESIEERTENVESAVRPTGEVGARERSASN